ncbi:MAG TPA: hypothetical protein VK912_03420 [Longimicrobiales bacterium]|nr:hypothetical protein [Longimicrobiales bacterium]
MKRTVRLLCLCALVLPGDVYAQAAGDPSFRAGTFMLTVEVGGAAFSDFERTQARPLDGGLELGDFARRVSARTAGSAGAWASYWIRDGLAVRAGISFVPSSFTVWNEDIARAAIESLRPAEADPTYASLSIWMASLSGVFRFPHSFGRVTPYGIVGAGLVRYHASEDAVIPPEARGRFASGNWQKGAGVVGIGAAIPLQRRSLLMSFELTNHISRSPLGDGSAGEMFELGGVAMQIDPDDVSSGDGDVGLTSHIRLALGLTLPLRW